MDLLPIKRALISVTHKEGLGKFADFLYKHGVELVSTGGTLKFLQGEGLGVTAVSTVTGFPEILGGRVKTLHPKIHGGILADKDNSEHLGTLAGHSIEPFDMVVVNLYDFESALGKNLPLRDMVEEIDIGGPCLLRASAKNFHSILVLPHFSFYEEAQELLEKNNMNIDLPFRMKMSTETFLRTSQYDAIIQKYLAEQCK